MDSVGLTPFATDGDTRRAQLRSEWKNMGGGAVFVRYSASEMRLRYFSVAVKVPNGRWVRLDAEVDVIHVPASDWDTLREMQSVLWVAAVPAAQKPRQYLIHCDLTIHCDEFLWGDRVLEGADGRSSARFFSGAHFPQEMVILLAHRHNPIVALIDGVKGMSVRSAGTNRLSALYDPGTTPSAGLTLGGSSLLRSKSFASSLSLKSNYDENFPLPALDYRFPPAALILQQSSKLSDVCETGHTSSSATDRPIIADTVARFTRSMTPSGHFHHRRDMRSTSRPLGHNSCTVLVLWALLPRLRSLSYYCYASFEVKELSLEGTALRRTSDEQTNSSEMSETATSTDTMEIRLTGIVFIALNDFPIGVSVTRSQLPPRFHFPAFSWSYLEPVSPVRGGWRGANKISNGSGTDTSPAQPQPHQRDK
ncbi:hypothetical protein BIW11_03825 [Tropilaelaps mercedesae]|uniref:Uncharacterized protein n=1 Tax=Tropilaelaps mercedesae TaxID=418985 RepID=A0A1V9XF96_9ACAR|nr:hypothetical protein BIW11_03825 [Tropilaelaps mercedesae]